MFLNSKITVLNENRKYNRYYFESWIKERTTIKKKETEKGKRKKKKTDEKVNYSLLVNGDYGIGKSTFVNNFFDKKVQYNVHKFSQYNYTEKSIISEFIDLSAKNKIFTDQSLNIQKFIGKSNILVIDENYYSELLRNYKIIKKLVDYNDKNFIMPIIIITNDNETSLYQNIKTNCDYMNLSVFPIEDKKKIFNIETDKYNEILNSTDNLNVLKRKIRMAINGISKCLSDYNKRCEIYTEEVNDNKKKSKINLSIFYNKSKLKNKNNIINHLIKCKFNYMSLSSVIQENYINPLLLKYEETGQKEIKETIDKINKNFKLSDKLESLINLNQYWELNKYFNFVSCVLPLYYLNKINVDNCLNISSVIYPKLYNKSICQKKRFNIVNELKLSTGKNSSDYYKLLCYLIIKKGKKANSNIASEDKLKEWLNFYNINKKNIKLLTSFNKSFSVFDVKKTNENIVKLLSDYYKKTDYKTH